MSRIPLLPADLDQPADLLAAIRARRGGSLLNLDRTLLHSPMLARAWNDYLGAIRGKLSLQPRLRELVICAVARLNGADYEFAQHAPEYRRAGGSDATLAALHDISTAPPAGTDFTPLERAALQVTCELTRDLRVSEAAFAALRAALPDPAQQVELMAVIATYNMVSRFLIGCDVPDEPGARD
mgnify:CR=1 FL=1